MMNNNKILTVSYGTFSCTLEGFDDSFGTMKAIAEYFRDLASDDRYFGAEPPVPDAEMLARIAEREISRRVEAREHEGRIVLSAADANAAEQAPAPVPAAPVGAALAAAAASVDIAPDVLNGDPSTDGATEESVEDNAPSVDASAEDDIETTALLDNVSEQTDDAAAEETVAESDEPEFGEVAQDTAPADDEIAPETTEDVVIEEISADTVQDSIADDIAADQDTAEDATAQNDEDSTDVDDSVEAFFADSQDSVDATHEDNEGDIDFPQVEDTVDLAPVAAQNPDSIAAKLQRIRAVVSQSQSEADDDDDMFEDQHAEDLTNTGDDADDVLSADFADAFEGDVAEHDTAEAADDAAAQAEDDDVVADAISDIEAAIEADDTDLTDVEAEEDSAEDDDIEAILARFDDVDAPSADDAVEDAVHALDTDTVAVDDFSEQDAQGDDALSGLDSLAAMLDEDVASDDDDAGENLFGDTSEAPAEAMADEIEAIDDNTGEDDIEIEIEADETALDDLMGDDDSEEQAVAPRRARILKVKRADLDAAIESGQLEAIDEDEDDDFADDAAADASSLSDEDEAELLADLAAVEAELPDVEAAENTMDVDSSSVEAPLEAPEPETTAADDDVERLMAEAENQMDEPEGSRRRNAFAHLKAAVMAKKADAKIGEDKAEDEGAFRSDLASVVIPRRPAVRGERAERPDVKRPAPLKLVAEQRVDIDATPTGPVRPRRVAAVEPAPEEVQTEDSGFADYASEMGAHNLPDLLEAAASYLSFVEGRDQFSRPQLMHKVRQVEKDDFSREDGLRSFGQLLRAGKIEKLKGGRFAATGDIGYRPDQRAAG